jgi:hypothetical protein
VTTRATPIAAWGPPALITSVNSPAGENDAFLTPGSRRDRPHSATDIPDVLGLEDDALPDVPIFGTSEDGGSPRTRCVAPFGAGSAAKSDSQ